MSTTPKRMRILLLTHRPPFPPNKGDKIRSHHLLEHLRRHHEVHLGCTVDDARDLEHLDELRRRVASLHYARIDGFAARLRRPLALLRGQPVSVPAFYSSSLQQDLDALLDTMRMDAVLAYSSPMAEYVFRSRHAAGALRTMRRWMDFIDVDSAKWADYAARSHGWRQRIYAREARLLADYETRIAREFDQLFLVSADERGALPAAIERERVTPLVNGVDLEYFASRPPPAAGLAPRVVFTGVMDYWPNVEGVQWFVREVWPRVRERVPAACFDIVGSRPTEPVRALAREPGVAVTGFVPDVRDYVAAATVCVAPLRIARGVQNKVLEAMAMARAVVGTPQALEGIAAARGRELLAAEDAAAFADAVAGLITRPDEAQRLGTAARAFVEAHHDWSRTLEPLDRLLAA